MEGDKYAVGFDRSDGGLVDGAEGWGCRGGGGRVWRSRWRRWGAVGTSVMRRRRGDIAV